MSRRLIGGSEVSNFPNSQEMTINSKCPDKWLFVDLETGDIWRWDMTPGQFRRAEPHKVDILKQVVKIKSDFV